MSLQLCYGQNSVKSLDDEPAEVPICEFSGFLHDGFCWSHTHFKDFLSHHGDKPLTYAGPKSQLKDFNLTIMINH